MSAKRKPVVGETLYRLSVGNAARLEPDRLIPVIVTSVGRKYFTCTPEKLKDSPHMGRQFHLESWREKTDISASYELFEDPQEYHDRKESQSIWDQCRNIFTGWKDRSSLSLDQLRQIKAIIDSGKEQA